MQVLPLLMSLCCWATFIFMLVKKEQKASVIYHIDRASSKKDLTQGNTRARREPTESLCVLYLNKKRLPNIRQPLEVMIQEQLWRSDSQLRIHGDIIVPREEILAG
jgi:hypothetical protein